MCAERDEGRPDRVASAGDAEKLIGNWTPGPGGSAPRTRPCRWRGFKVRNEGWPQNQPTAKTHLPLLGFSRGRKEGLGVLVLQSWGMERYFWALPNFYVIVNSLRLTRLGAAGRA